MASISTVSCLPTATRPLSPLEAVDFKRRVVKGFCENADVSCSKDANVWKGAGCNFDRRKLLLVSSIGLIGNAFSNGSIKGALASEFADMPALRGKDYGKSKMRYPDYTETQSGLQYKDLRVGEGPMAKMGETVVVIPAFEEAIIGMAPGGIRR